MNELAARLGGSATKDDVMATETVFDEGRYKDLLHLLHKSLGHGDLTDHQKKAMAVAAESDLSLNEHGGVAEAGRGVQAEEEGSAAAPGVAFLAEQGDLESR